MSVYCGDICSMSVFLGDICFMSEYYGDICSMSAVLSKFVGPVRQSDIFYEMSDKKC